MENARQKIHHALIDFYPEQEIKSISRLLLSDITGWTFTELITNKNSVFSENQIELLDKYLEKLKLHVPLQYVLGKTEFFGLPFLVNENVLIPRPETEELVDWILQEKNDKQLKILDLGTGSGCIPVALKFRLPDDEISACDISDEALKIARSNARLNQVDVSFFHFDILNDIQLNQNFDIFVSNPPYIPQNESQQMDKHVVEHEPHLALFVPDLNPLLFYERIASLAMKYLNEGGKLFFEIHRDHGEMCVQMLQNKGFTDVVLKKDFSQNNRMIRAFKPF